VDFSNQTIALDPLDKTCYPQVLSAPLDLEAFLILTGDEVLDGIRILSPDVENLCLASDLPFY
jgi:hypothetical protein